MRASSSIVRRALCQLRGPEPNFGGRIHKRHVYTQTFKGNIEQYIIFNYIVVLPKLQKFVHFHQQVPKHNKSCKRKQPCPQQFLEWKRETVWSWNSVSNTWKIQIVVKKIEIFLWMFRSSSFCSKGGSGRNPTIFLVHPPRHVSGVVTNAFFTYIFFNNYFWISHGNQNPGL